MPIRNSLKKTTFSARSVKVSEWLRGSEAEISCIFVDI